MFNTAGYNSATLSGAAERKQPANGSTCRFQHLESIVVIVRSTEALPTEWHELHSHAMRFQPKKKKKIVQPLTILLLQEEQDAGEHFITAANALFL